MFAYPFDSDYIVYDPRIHRSPYPRARNFYGPAQYFRPCSYYHNNASPFYYSTPQNYFAYDDDEDEEYQKEQLFRELLNRKMAYKQQEEREREQERSKRFHERKAGEQSQQPGASPKRSFKVKIQGGDDETKSEVERSQAARKIFNFIKNQAANRQTRKILDKFHTLRTIENELKEIHDTKVVVNLTFDEEHEKHVLPISVENKRFLEYEEKVLKLFDKLDRVQSEGVDIVRERRRFLVKFAQALLEELDNEKENQWKAFSEKQLNPDVVMDDAEKSDEGAIVSPTEEIDISMSSSVLPENEGNDIIVDEEQLDSNESFQSNIELDNQGSVEPIQE